MSDSLIRHPEHLCLEKNSRNCSRCRKMICLVHIYGVGGLHFNRNSQAGVLALALALAFLAFAGTEPSVICICILGF